MIENLKQMYIDLYFKIEGKKEDYPIKQYGLSCNCQWKLFQRRLHKIQEHD